MTAHQLHDLDRLLSLAADHAVTAGLPQVIVGRIEAVRAVLPQLTELEDHS